MNYSFINNTPNKVFIKEPEKLYRTYPSDVPLQNYNMNMYENNETNNWKTEGSLSKTILSGISHPTPLSELFFSRPNIKRLQNKIKIEIFNRTNGQFVLNVDQNETDLLVVMRAVYIADAIEAPYKITHQVKELNKKTIQRIIPDMISMIKQDKQYQKEITTPLQPIALPVCSNVKGLRTLPSQTSIYGWTTK
jgi:hypothetical protein